MKQNCRFHLMPDNIARAIELKFEVWETCISKDCIIIMNFVIIDEKGKSSPKENDEPTKQQNKELV
jgi:hypothetical protein